MDVSAIFVAIVALAGGGGARGLDNSDLQHYLKLRHMYGIHTAVDEPALDTFVGTRVVEISGVVNGVFRVNGQASVLIGKPGGQYQPVNTKNVPDWLESGAVPARLIVKATRETTDSKLSVWLLAASPAEPIVKIEAKAIAAEAAAAARRESSRKATRTSFRVIPTTFRARKVWTLPASQAAGYYASFIKRENPRLSNAKAMEIAQAILGFSIHFGVDARLIMAMVMVESGFDPNSTSHTGAQGLGQLMPSTARWMGVSNAYDTTDNLFGTVKLVRTHLQNYNAKTGDPYTSIVLMLAAYNAGEGAVSRHGGVPPYRETQAYIRHVIRLYRQFSGY
jgi:soluble lytic murein transglycosylase-like protein